MNKMKIASSKCRCQTAKHENLSQSQRIGCFKNIKTWLGLVLQDDEYVHLPFYRERHMPCRLSVIYLQEVKKCIRDWDPVYYWLSKNALAAFGCIYRISLFVLCAVIIL